LKAFFTSFTFFTVDIGLPTGLPYADPDRLVSQGWTDGSPGRIAICALLLAGLRIYATIAQVVEDRQREMAIRSALGASGRALIALAAGGVGVAAIWWPARRAAAVDPAVVLKQA